MDNRRALIHVNLDTVIVVLFMMKIFGLIAISWWWVVLAVLVKLVALYIKFKMENNNNDPNACSTLVNDNNND